MLYEHTPGPWTVVETGSPDIYNGVHHIFYVTASGGAIAQVFPCGNPRKAFGNPELSDMPEPSNGTIRKANARLVSYAPLLLEGVIMARTTLAIDEALYGQSIKLLDELIANATGGAS